MAATMATGPRPKSNRIRPRAAHADVRRSQCRREPAKLAVRKIDRRPVFIEIGVHAGGGAPAYRSAGRLAVLSRTIRMPYRPAVMFQHLHVLVHVPFYII